MSNPSASDFRASSPKRRAILAGLGTGICAAVVTALRWPEGKSREMDAEPKSPSSPPAQAEPVAASDAPAHEPLIPKQLSREWFLPHVQSVFQVADAPALRLVEVSPASILSNGTLSYTAFTLLFEAPKNCTTPEGIHRLRHDTLGEMDLFLAPVGRSDQRVCYEAAFTLRS